MFIDKHIHLNDDRYQEELDQVIEEALKENVKLMFVIGYNKKSSIKAVEIANKYDNCYALVGIHPSDAKSETDCSFIYDLCKNKKVVGIGEIGLDYYWDRSYDEIQKEVFIKQLKIANELNLPISVHAREATQETFDIIKQYKPKGIIHCYSGSVEIAREYIKMGLYIGVGGVVTFKNSKVLKNVVSDISLDYIVTETDGPYLAPTPYRGKTNYPKYIPLIASEIATIKNVTIEEVEKTIESNVKRLFNI